MENRRTVLAKLAVKMAEVDEIKKVIRVYVKNFDLTQFTQAQLPLLAIIEPAEETDDEMTSQKSLMALATQFSIHFLHWGITPDSTYETLVKAIRDKVGANFDLDGVVTEARVSDLSVIGGEMPLYNFDMDLEMKYYLDEMVT